MRLRITQRFRRQCRVLLVLCPSAFSFRQEINKSPVKCRKTLPLRITRLRLPCFSILPYNSFTCVIISVFGAFPTSDQAYTFVVNSVIDFVHARGGSSLPRRPGKAKFLSGISKTSGRISGKKFREILHCIRQASARDVREAVAVAPC